MAFISEAIKLLRTFDKKKNPFEAEEEIVGEEEENGDNEVPQVPEPLFDPLTCNICMERRKNSSFDPCGHTACQECAYNLYGNGDQCHMCRAQINCVRNCFF